MAGSDENNPGIGLIRSTNAHGDVPVGREIEKFGVGAVGQNRRALSDIDRNIVVAPLPCAVKKRGLSEKQSVCEKRQCIAVHRPVTRNYAAQLSKGRQVISKNQDLKKHANTAVAVSKPNDSSIINLEDGNENTNFAVPMFVQHTVAILDDSDKMDLKKQVNTSVAARKPIHSSIVNLDDGNENSDFAAPMFIQHTEGMLDEIDKMLSSPQDAEEVEMEDMDHESITDIDSPDKKNSLAVVEYVDALYAHYRKSESASCVSPNYMDQQADINDRMRSILIDWLIEVHYRFELMEETLYLAVNLIDRFLAAQSIVRRKLQLVGVTAMLLACKYEEVRVLVINDLILISGKAYTRQEVLEMEKTMVNALQFNLSVPTPYVFLRRFLKAAISDAKLDLLASYIIELSLVEYEMLKFPPSLLAAAAIFTAQCSLARSKQWSLTSQWYSDYSEDELMECARLMVAFHQKAPTAKLTGVYKKYTRSKYGHAANSEPAYFLLENHPDRV